jgi:hypothetical protein
MKQPVIEATVFSGNVEFGLRYENALSAHILATDQHPDTLIGIATE